MTQADTCIELTVVSEQNIVSLAENFERESKRRKSEANRRPWKRQKSKREDGFESEKQQECIIEVLERSP